MTDGATPSTSKIRLTGIEALRGIAAVAVLLYHAARHVDAAYGMPRLMQVFQSGHAGVDLFFVLSGFLIFHVHARDVGRPDRIGHYARQRFTRVVPLYWLALALTIAKMTTGGHAFPQAGSLATSLFLLPGWEQPILGPAWSLQHELLFYLVFAILLLNRAAGVALLALWALFLLSNLGGTWNQLVPFQIAGHYNLEFFLGIGAALLAPHLRRGGMLAIAGGAAFIVSGISESRGLFDGTAALARLFYGVPSALLITGLVLLSRRSKGLRIPAWLGALGGASYSLYLFQFLFMGIAVKLWSAAGLDRPETAIGLFLLMTLASLIGGLTMTRLVEKPLLRWMRGGKQENGQRPALEPA